MADLIQHYLPVFHRYLDQIEVLAGNALPEQLAARLTPESFSALENFAIAQGYVLRSLCPLAGQDVCELEDVSDCAGLLARGALVRQVLSQLDDADLQADTVSHVAGQAHLTQTPLEFISLYAAPNFFFHLSMGYAILRAQGCDIGKGSFDGFHCYPQGFSFVTDAQRQISEVVQ